MKSIQILLIALTVGLFATSCEKSGSAENSGETTETKAPETKAPVAENYNIDVEKAEVRWNGSKAEGQHFGSFGLSKGTLSVSEAGVEGGEVVINVSTMTPMDELPDEAKGKLVGHLTSEDFFNTAEYPTISLKITGSSKYAGAGETAPEGMAEALNSYVVTSPTHTINGDLVIKGESHAISFPAKIDNNADGSLNATALMTFDRRDYGLRFMSDTESTVNPTIHVGFSVMAKK